MHYGTDDLTMRSLRALVEDDVSPPTTIVVVDNGPGEPLGPRVRRELPTVEVVSPGRNLGFAGGCNAGIRHLGPVDHIALVNSDAVVRPGWLVPLLAALDADPGVGAACPKILFEGGFHEVDLDAAPTWVPGRGDHRPLAWRLAGVRADDCDVTDRCLLVEGFWEPEVDGVWAGAHASVLVPESEHGRVAFRVGAPPGRAVQLVVRGGADRQEASVVVGEGTIDVSVSGQAPSVSVINNVGNERQADGYGIDRGYQEVDRGQHDEAVDVPAWCGGAVLLRRHYLDDVGLFDERLFLYYEDLELSLRGAAVGWRYQLCPTSVVEHRHGASSLGASRRAERLKERNRLLVLLRHDGPRAFAQQLVRFMLITASYVRRDMVAPALTPTRPRTHIVRTRLAALASALRWAPAMLAGRRADGRRSGCGA
ncbi:MAG: glycosyltransferase [Acidimicrobiales bacterium]